ncbi:hypothetical protein RRG08_029254 [Elysia crispata]|uniref:Uncharacterized protein n=1 Tax=Elysia crispata TaxID=231223 RepID=A0AAE1DZU1_9GAST|nr:hypothetical protein RRG08_029254 [Elysia crispata]
MASILKTLFLWAQSFVNDALLIWNRNQVLPFSVIMMMSFWMKHDDNNSMAFTSNSKEDEDGHNTIQPTGITPCQEHPTLNQPESILESQPSPMRKRVFDCITCWRKNDTMVPSTDQRGKHNNRPRASTEEQVQRIVEHIRSFRDRQSRYALNDTRRLFLPEELNLTKMYNMYCEQFPHHPCSHETATSMSDL